MNVMGGRGVHWGGVLGFGAIAPTSAPGKTFKP